MEGSADMEEHSQRRVLSDELHARAFHEFEGAGRFIRYVFLTDGNSGAVIDYINAWRDYSSKTNELIRKLQKPRTRQGFVKQ